jgi:hypothetical protein
VVVEHGGHGGTSAAPIVKKVLEAFFADRLPMKVEPPSPPAELRAGRWRQSEAANAAAPVSR